MKLPAEHPDFRIPATRYQYPRIPLGFHDIGYGLGNGDVFGAYWPVGREDHEPIICETFHDDGSIEPFFSSLSTFLAAAGSNYQWFEAAPTLEDDPASPWALLRAARPLQRPETVPKAIALLERAVEIMPEYGEAQRMLSSLYFRTQDYEKSLGASLQGFLASPSFGGGQSWGHLKKLTQHLELSSALANNPLIKHGIDRELSFGTYGKKTQDDYLIFKDAISYFEDIGDYVRASTFAQTYCEHMHSQTIDFQQHYDFDLTEHIAWQRRLASQLPAGRRELAGK